MHASAARSSVSRTERTEACTHEPAGKYLSAADRLSASLVSGIDSACLQQSNQMALTPRNSAHSKTYRNDSENCGGSHLHRIDTTPMIRQINPPDRTLLRATYLPTHLPVAGRHRHRSRARPCRAFSLLQCLVPLESTVGPLPSERHCLPSGTTHGRCPCCPTTRANE